jgi:hypothetical protein
VPFRSPSRPEGVRAETLIEEVRNWRLPIRGVHDVVSAEHGFVITRVVVIPRGAVPNQSGHHRGSKGVGLISGRWLTILAAAAAWTIFFSMFNRPRIRGLRNIGLLACYVLGVVMLFRLPWLSALVTWGIAGLVSGVLYFGYELLAYVTAPDRTTIAPPNPITVVHGLALWPIMLPEAIEYVLAELGILKAPVTRAD